MNKLKILFISVLLYIFLIFSSCSNNSNPASDEVSQISDIYVAAANDNLAADESPDITESLNSQAPVGLIDENEFLEQHGYLYDIDLDGIDEVLVLYFDQVNEIIIYKNEGGRYTVWGEPILFNNIHPEWFSVDGLTLYYDPSEDNYFYINEYDVWEKYFNYADINKYSITENGLVKSNIAHCEFLYGEEIDFSVNTVLGNEADPVGTVKFEDMVHYHNGIDEYLNRFQKIKAITRDELTFRPLSQIPLESIYGIYD